MIFKYKMNVADLNKLAALTQRELPTRKADLAAVMMKYLQGEGLRKVWQGIGDLQRAAVAEVVHSGPTQFSSNRIVSCCPRTRTHCLPAGERHLAVPAPSEVAFKRGLRELGYILSTGESRLPRIRRVNLPYGPAAQGTED
jgi:hypothetical protein